VVSTAESKALRFVDPLMIDADLGDSTSMPRRTPHLNSSWRKLSDSAVCSPRPTPLKCRTPIASTPPQQE
jgi:hypothetical protein